MTKGATRLTDLQETEWTRSIQIAGGGVGLIAVSLLLIYFGKQLMPGFPAAAWVVLFLATTGIVAGVACLGYAGHRSYRAHRTPRYRFPCPYCSMTNRFVGRPTQDFTCEHCQRDVHFRDGEPVPVQKILCQACHAEHLVAITVERYLCDRCNRPLRIDGTLSEQAIIAGIDGKSADAAQPNQDVVLLAYDPRKIDALTFKLQDLLLTNQPEARRLLQSVSKTAPLTVGANLAPRKADAISRQLQELGATVTMRPTQGGERAPGAQVK